MKNLCLFKVLSGIKHLKICCQDSLVFLPSSETSYFLRSTAEGFLLVTQASDFKQLLKYWLEEGQVEVLSTAKKLVTSNEAELFSSLSETCLISKHDPSLNTVQVTWQLNSGFLIHEPSLLSSQASIQLQMDLEDFRESVSQSLLVQRAKLRAFQAVFRVNSLQRLFSGVIFYKLMPADHSILLKKTSRSSVSLLTSPLPLVSKTAACSPVHLASPSTASLRSPPAADQVSEKISEIMKDDESVKYISYRGWEKKVNSGQRLLPNELAFARKLASFGKKELRTDNVKELKNLSTKMVINLDKNRSKRQLQEAIKQGYLNEILFKSVKFSIPPKPLKQKSKKKTEVKVNYGEQINHAVEQFDRLQQKVKPRAELELIKP